MSTFDALISLKSKSLNGKLNRVPGFNSELRQSGKDVNGILV